MREVDITSRRESTMLALARRRGRGGAGSGSPGTKEDGNHVGDLIRVAARILVAAWHQHRGPSTSSASSIAEQLFQAIAQLAQRLSDQNDALLLIQLLKEPVEKWLACGHQKYPQEAPSARLLRQIQNTWSAFLTCISLCDPPLTLDSTLLSSLAPLLSLAFRHPCQAISSRTLSFWAATFGLLDDGQSSSVSGPGGTSSLPLSAKKVEARPTSPKPPPLHYPPVLARVLYSLRERVEISLPFWPTNGVESNTPCRGQQAPSRDCANIAPNETAQGGGTINDRQLTVPRSGGCSASDGQHHVNAASVPVLLLDRTYTGLVLLGAEGPEDCTPAHISGTGSSPGSGEVPAHMDVIVVNPPGVNYPLPAASGEPIASENKLALALEVVAGEGEEGTVERMIREEGQTSRTPSALILVSEALAGTGLECEFTTAWQEGQGALQGERSKILRGVLKQGKRSASGLQGKDDNLHEKKKRVRFTLPSEDDDGVEYVCIPPRPPSEGKMPLTARQREVRAAQRGGLSFGASFAMERGVGGVRTHTNADFSQSLVDSESQDAESLPHDVPPAAEPAPGHEPVQGAAAAPPQETDIPSGEDAEMMLLSVPDDEGEGGLEAVLKKSWGALLKGCTSKPAVADEVQPAHEVHRDGVIEDAGRDVGNGGAGMRGEELGDAGRASDSQHCEAASGSLDLGKGSPSGGGGNCLGEGVESGGEGEGSRGDVVEDAPKAVEPSVGTLYLTRSSVKLKDCRPDQVASVREEGRKSVTVEKGGGLGGARVGSGKGVSDAAAVGEGAERDSKRKRSGKLTSHSSPRPLRRPRSPAIRRPRALFLSLAPQQRRSGASSGMRRLATSRALDTRMTLFELVTDTSPINGFQEDDPYDVTCHDAEKESQQLSSGDVDPLKMLQALSQWRGWEGFGKEKLAEARELVVTLQNALPH